jgi:hypothetical protein
VSRTDRVDAAIEASPLVVGLVLVAQILRTWANRLTTPFDLEWMEGGMLVHALRLSEGDPIYVRPTPDWIPYVYPPGYASLVAALSAVFPLDYPLGRAVSIVGTLGAAAAIAAFGWRHRAPAAGVVGACVFLGTYRASGAFFDLVRPDGLAAGLLAWTLYLATDRRRGTAVAGGLLLAATFLVKHHVAAYGLPLALVIWSRDSVRRALAFGLSAAVPALGFTVALELRSGHFLDYLLRVPASHPHDWERWFPGTPGELAAVELPAIVVAGVWIAWRVLQHRRPADLAAFGVAAALGAAGLAAAVRAGDAAGVADAPPPITGFAVAVFTAGAAATAWHLGRRGLRFDRGLVAVVAVGGTILAVASVMRSHNGGFANVLMPAHLALAFAFPVAGATTAGSWPRAGLALAGFAQFAVMGAQLHREELLVDDEDLAAHATLLGALRDQCDGEILSPYAPWLPRQVGRKPGFHLIALWDIAHPTNPFRGDVKKIERAAGAHRWSCVVAGGGRKLGFGIDKAYPVSRPVRLPPKAMMPRTGWRVRVSTLQFPPGEPK